MFNLIISFFFANHLVLKCFLFSLRVVNWVVNCSLFLSSFFGKKASDF